MANNKICSLTFQQMKFQKQSIDSIFWEFANLQIIFTTLKYL